MKAKQMTIIATIDERIQFMRSEFKQDLAAAMNVDSSDEEPKDNK